MIELQPSERAVLVDLLDHQGVAAHVVLIPDLGRLKGGVVGGPVDGAVLGVDDTPTALRLHAAHPSQRLGHAIPHPSTVGDLVEAILGRDGTDLNGLEEDVVTRIAAHGGSCGCCNCRRRSVGSPAATAMRRRQKQPDWASWWAGRVYAPLILTLERETPPLRIFRNGGSYAENR